MNFLTFSGDGKFGFELDSSICTDKVSEPWKLDCIRGVKSTNTQVKCGKLDTQEEIAECITETNSKFNECKKIQDKDQKFECYNNI